MVLRPAIALASRARVGLSVERSLKAIVGILIPYRPSARHASDDGLSPRPCPCGPQSASRSSGLPPERRRATAPYGPVLADEPVVPGRRAALTSGVPQRDPHQTAATHGQPLRDRSACRSTERSSIIGTTPARCTDRRKLAALQAHTRSVRVSSPPPIMRRRATASGDLAGVLRSPSSEAVTDSVETGVPVRLVGVVVDVDAWRPDGRRSYCPSRVVRRPWCPVFRPITRSYVLSVSGPFFHEHTAETYRCPGNPSRIVGEAGLG